MDSWEKVWQVRRLLVERAEHEAAGHLRINLVVVSFSYHLRVLVKVIKGKARILHIIGVHWRIHVEGCSSGISSLVDRKIVAGRLCDQGGVQNLEVLVRCFV